MGKTSLLQHYAAEVAERGVHAVWGTCWEGDQAPALWPWTQVVRTLLDQDRDEEAVTAELVVVLPERAHIAGGVGEKSTTTAGGVKDKAGTATLASDEAGRLRVFDAVGRLLGRQPLMAAPARPAGGRSSGRRRAGRHARPRRAIRP
jgi:hypothetical protein